MAVGVGTAVTGVLVALAIPQALGARADRVAARHPHVVFDQASTRFRVREIDDLLGATPLHRVLLATASGNRAPPPPGCTRFPAPGTACASPELARRLDLHPGLARRFDDRITQRVDPRGLAGPGELVLYQGVERRSLVDASPAVGWQPLDTDGADGSATPTSALAELGLLVVMPAVLFLTVCARLSATVRARRVHALRLVGLDRRSLGFVAAFDGRVAGLIGGLIGLAAYAVAVPRLARSGRLGGLTWFREDTSIGLVGAAVVLVGAAVLTGWLCRVAGGGMVDRPAARGPVRPAGLWRIVPVWSASIGLAGLLVVHRSSDGAGVAVVPVLALAVVAAGGLVLAVRPLAERVAGHAAARAERLVVRLGCRRVQWDAAGAVRVLTATLLLVLTAGIGSAVLRDASLAAGPRSAHELVTVDAGRAASPSQREDLAHVPSIARMATLATRPVPHPPPSTSSTGAFDLRQGVPVVFASCRDLRKLGEPGLRSCHDGRAYRVDLPGGRDLATQLPPGLVVRLSRASGRGTAALTIPRATFPVASFDGGLLPSDSILVTRPPDPDLLSPRTTFQYLVPGSDDGLTRFEDRVARVAPLAQVQLATANLEAIATYRIHGAVVGLGISIGAVLGVVAMVVAAVDRALERRRNVAALTALGLTRWELVRVQAVQLLLPAGIGLALAVGVAHLVGTAYLSAGGLQRGWYPASLVAAAEAAAAALAGLGASAAVVAGRRTTAALLRGE